MFAQREEIVCPGNDTLELCRVKHNTLWNVSGDAYIDKSYYNIVHNRCIGTNKIVLQLKKKR